MESNTNKLMAIQQNFCYKSTLYLISRIHFYADTGMCPYPKGSPNNWLNKIQCILLSIFQNMLTCHICI